MNILFFFTLFFLFTHDIAYAGIFVQDQNTKEEKFNTGEVFHGNIDAEKDSKGESFISFSYSNVNLTTIINQIAQYKSYNVIFAVGQNAINVVVSFSLN